MKCEYCDNDVPGNVNRCPSCGAAVHASVSINATLPNGQHQQPEQNTVSVISHEAPIIAKSRVAYVLLGLFLGSFGIHNFYAGRPNRAIGQLLTTLLVGWWIIPLFAVWIWCIVDVCAITTDGEGVRFQ